MGAYFEIPAAFRQSLFEEFAVSVRRMIGASRHLELLERFDADGKEDSEFRHQTIFSFLPHRQGVALDMEQCARLYRAMGEDVSQLLPASTVREDCRIASRHCQIGQPVALRHRAGAVLRLSALRRGWRPAAGRGARQRLLRRLRPNEATSPPRSKSWTGL